MNLSALCSIYKQQYIVQMGIGLHITNIEKCKNALPVISWVPLGVTFKIFAVNAFKLILHLQFFETKTLGLGYLLCFVGFTLRMEPLTKGCKLFITSTSLSVYHIGLIFSFAANLCKGNFFCIFIYLINRSAYQTKPGKGITRLKNNMQTSTSFSDCQVTFLKKQKLIQ